MTFLRSGEEDSFLGLGSRTEFSYSLNMVVDLRFDFIVLNDEFLFQNLDSV